MPWSRRFDDPIPLPDGRALVTLEEAGRYIQRLPKATQAMEHWQTATEALMMAAEERGPLMHARIAMIQALNFGKAKPDQAPRRKRAKSYRIIR